MMQGSQPVLCHSLEGVGLSRGGREAQEGGDTRILMADSHGCTAKPTQHIKQLSSN